MFFVGFLLNNNQRTRSMWVGDLRDRYLRSAALWSIVPLAFHSYPSSFSVGALWGERAQELAELNAASNKLSSIPTQLAQCSRLTSLHLQVLYYHAS